MEPLFMLVAVTAALYFAGALGARRLHSLPVALRGGLAAMFTLTGIVHFVGMRADLIEMVPPAIPNPGLMVTLTGLFELAGALGLLIRPTVPFAAAGLTLQLIVMYPANVYAAQHDIVTAWYDDVFPRTVMQLVFLAATTTVLASTLRSRRPVRQAPTEPDHIAA